MRPINPSLHIAEFDALDAQAKLRHLVAFAAFAPSSHNTQPWLFVLDAAHSTVMLRANRQRTLGYSDPTGREMTISLGAALQNFIFAAEFFGCSTHIDYLHEGDDIARIEVHYALDRSAHEHKDPSLMRAMLSRHNNRFPYEDRAIGPDGAELFLADDKDGTVQSHLVTDPQRKEAICEIVGNALQDALDDKDFRHELSLWIKNSHPKHEDGMPGYNLAMPRAVAYMFPMILRTFRLGKFQKGMELRSLRQTPAFVILSTAVDSRREWLRTGMRYEQIAVVAEARGLRTGVLAAAIEVGEYYKQLQKVLATDRRPQMFFRTGYCAKVPKASPRLSLDKIIVQQTNE